MGNLCSKFFNINNSNNDLKAKLDDEPIEDLEKKITRDSKKNMKKNYETKTKQKNKDNTDDGNNDNESSENEDSESETKKKHKHKKIKKNKNVPIKKKQKKKEESDSQIEYSESDDNESDDSDDKNKRIKKIKSKTKNKKIEKKKKGKSDSESEYSESDDNESDDYESKKKKIKKIKRKTKNKKIKKKKNEESESEDSKSENLEEKDKEKKIDKPQSKYIDLPEKRKLAFYLISNDYNVFKRHLSEVQQLNDEEFNELFEGNTDYKAFSVQNLKDFLQLVSKFDDNKELLIEWYKEEKYYEFILQIWKPNILQKLKELNNENERIELLNQSHIDTSNWDKDFREYFISRINQSPIKKYAERMKYYIKENYGDFDELIKSVDKCKSNVEKSEETICKKTLKANVDSTIDKMINQFIPNFISNMKEGYNKFKKEKKKKTRRYCYRKTKII